jgi:hypothetical protein
MTIEYGLVLALLDRDKALHVEQPHDRTGTETSSTPNDGVTGAP